MIFDCGIEKSVFDCTNCGKRHYEISVGEERLVCVCGAVLTFRVEEKAYVYFWMNRPMCQARLEYNINSDKRNLC